MTMPGSPTVRRRRLAAELREIRESKGESGDAVAKALHWSPSKISRYERAKTGLPPAEVEAARLLRDHRASPRRPARARPGRLAEGLVGGLRRQPVPRLSAVHRPRGRGQRDRRMAV